jgi:hypothetical protein
MLIPVVFCNGECRLISASNLDNLIASCEIKQFLRLEGWVTVGCDRIRLGESIPYQKERRQNNKTFHKKNLFTDTKIGLYV